MLTEPFKKTGQLVTIYDEQTKSLSVRGPNSCKYLIALGLEKVRLLNISMAELL